MGRIDGPPCTAMGSQIREQNTLYSISFHKLGSLVLSLPIFATVFCITWSIIFDFEASTATHCRVKNYLPSISAAIGGFTPQRYVWRICIGLHCSPRIMIALAYYNYHTQVHVGTKNSLYEKLATLCSLLHILENMSLVLLTYISSTENHGVHENSFIVFIVSSQLYMVLTCVVCRWGMHSSRRPTEKEKKSLTVKYTMCIFNIAIFLVGVIFFFRHNRYCEPGESEDLDNALDNRKLAVRFRESVDVAGSELPLCPCAETDDEIGPSVNEKDDQRLCYSHLVHGQLERKYCT
ncbi:hypothetical protein ScPMuIL_010780 [Solemya velum]